MIAARGMRVAFAVLAVSAWAAVARAEDARVVLAYTREPGAEACPDQSALADAVSSRLGYVPFDAAAERTVRVRITHAGHRYEASVEIVDATGAVTGTRELAARGSPDRCPIADALVLAVSLAIDPMTLAPPVPAPDAPSCPALEVPVCAEPAPCPESPPPEPASGPPPPELPVAAPAARARLGAALVGVLAPEPFPTGGLRLSAGARLGDFSLDGELRGDVPTTGGDADGRTVTATWLSLTVALCGHLGPVALCGTTSQGALVGWGGGVAHPSTQITALCTVGARAALELALDEVLALAIGLDGAIVLTPTVLAVDDRALHVVPIATGSLTVGVVAEIP